MPSLLFRVEPRRESNPLVMTLSGHRSFDEWPLCARIGLSRAGGGALPQAWPCRRHRVLADRGSFQRRLQRRHVDPEVGRRAGRSERAVSYTSPIRRGLWCFRAWPKVDDLYRAHEALPASGPQSLLALNSRPFRRMARARERALTRGGTTKHHAPTRAYSRAAAPHPSANTTTFVDI